MTSGPVKLADQFAEANAAQWRALVDKALKGADFDKRMVSKTADGLKVEPLYTAANAVSSTQAARPGAAPYTRGTKAQPEGLGWDIRQMHLGADPVAVNQSILADLEGGVTSIVIEIGQGLGLSPDEATLTRALNGVYLDFVPISLVAGETTADAASSLTKIWNEKAIPVDKRRAAYGADPLGDLARTGRLSVPLDKALGEAAQLAKHALGLQGVQALRADGVPYHMAGATEAQELAAMLASLVAYLRAMQTAGISPDDALTKFEVCLAVDDDQFMGLAKLRAARKLVWRVADACGAGAGAAVADVPFNAVTSMRMMAKRDPWTNILRTTIACTAAALGGADAICVVPFTMALGQPDAFAKRVARNIQIVCQEESNLGRVADPAGGSWYIENLTNDLAAKAWALFQDIERQGGMAKALQSGFIQAECAKSADVRAQAIATGRMELTGVSAFPKLGDDGVKVSDWAPITAVKQAPAAVTVEPLTMTRNAAPFEVLRDAADAHAATSGKPYEVFLASIGQVVDHNIRSTWIKNYLAAGGIAATMTDGYADAAAAAAAFKASGLKAACICSSDAINAVHAEATARALKAAGCTFVLMAGKPGDNVPALTAAGVDQFLYAGQDAIAVLEGLHIRLGKVI